MGSNQTRWKGSVLFCTRLSRELFQEILMVFITMTSFQQYLCILYMYFKCLVYIVVVVLCELLQLSCVYCCQLCVLLQLSCVYCCHVMCICCTMCVLLIFYFRCWATGQKSISRRSCDRPPRHSFFLVSLCLYANAEMVPNISSCHFMLLMQPSRLKFISNQFHIFYICKITTATG